ncbi:MAG: hypothetical protein RL261_843 [Pseudomonadota bacterium]|jgi:hypothetical protein
MPPGTGIDIVVELLLRQPLVASEAAATNTAAVSPESRCIR